MMEFLEACASVMLAIVATICGIALMATVVALFTLY